MFALCAESHSSVFGSTQYFSSYTGRTADDSQNTTFTKCASLWRSPSSRLQCVVGSNRLIVGKELIVRWFVDIYGSVQIIHILLSSCVTPIVTVVLLFLRVRAPHYPLHVPLQHDELCESTQKCKFASGGHISGIRTSKSIRLLLVGTRQEQIRSSQFDRQ